MSSSRPYRPRQQGGRVVPARLCRRGLLASGSRSGDAADAIARRAPDRDMTPGVNAGRRLAAAPREPAWGLPCHRDAGPRDRRAGPPRPRRKALRQVYREWHEFPIRGNLTRFSVQVPRRPGCAPPHPRRYHWRKAHDRFGKRLTTSGSGPVFWLHDFLDPGNFPSMGVQVNLGHSKPP
jgi:hypothetical protein